MNVRYRVTLTLEEREGLRSFVHVGKGAFRRLKRAQILLASDAGSTDVDIAANVAVGRVRRCTPTVHYTPKHASWLNSQCLDRRIPTKAILVSEVKAWEKRRNREKARVRWMFTVEKAREKLGRAYPALTSAIGTQAAA